MTENDVVHAVANHLQSAGFRIENKLTTQQRGVDIEATHESTGQRLLVEAKGGTSSKPGTNRYGLEFSSGQAESHVSRAFFTAARLRQKHANENAVIGLAFPDDGKHRALISKILDSLSLLDIVVFFVAEDGQIELLGNLAKP